MAAEAPRLTAFRRSWLERRFGDGVRFNAPLARRTSLGVGGPAEAWVRPTDPVALGEVLRWAGDEGIPWTVIGDGTNLLAPDAGVAGLIIGLTGGFAEFAVSGAGRQTRVTAGAGLRTRSLCRRTIDRGLDGLMAGVGIPGTVGGAMAVNAGNRRGAVSDALDRVRIMDRDGRVCTLDRSALSFSYRETRWPEAGPAVILSAVFRVRPCSGGRASLVTEAEALRTERWQRQPRGARSAGCFFRNPATGPPAGALIDQAGLKGASVGGARVSRRHANFIVTRDGATAADVKTLAERVQETVFRRFGVRLDPEVRTLGA